MNIHRESARRWSISYNPDIRSAEISSGLEELLKSNADLNSDGSISSYYGRSLDRIVEIILTKMQNPPKDVSFGELDLSLFKRASTS
jgi:hypothetical protein